MQPFRLPPKLPASLVKTYQLLAPTSTHRRPATCAEVDCAAHARGWTTTVDVATELGARQANYVRLHSGRAFTVSEAGTLVTFTFPAGQRCFAQHSVTLEREPIYVVRDGDWRGNPRGTRPRIHASGVDWRDDFAEHQDKIAQAVEKG